MAISVMYVHPAGWWARVTGDSSRLSVREPPNGLELPALDRPARVPARRGGQSFYSMSSETAGKCAFALRRKPFGTSELLGVALAGNGLRADAASQLC